MREVRPTHIQTGEKFPSYGLDHVRLPEFEKDAFQVVYRFENGYGASIIRGPYSYGGSAKLFELAVIRWDGDDFELCVATPVTHNVIGHIEADELADLLQRIRLLPDMLYASIYFCSDCGSYYERPGQNWWDESACKVCDSFNTKFIRPV